MSVHPFSTPDAVKGLAMDVKGVAPRDVIPSALILAVSTKAGHVEGDAPVVRVPFVKLEGSAGFVPEGDAIPESSPQDTERLVQTGKVASLVPVSLEQYGQEDAANLLTDALKLDLVRKANRAFLAQPAPVAPAVTPPAGLIHQGLSTVSSSIVSSHSLDPLADAIAQIENAGGEASHILAHPLAWAELVKLKVTTESNQSLLGAGTDTAVRQLLSLPVLVDRDVPQSSLIVLDKRAILSAYGDVQIATSTDFKFDQDAITVRATFRFGAVVSDVNRVVLVNVVDES